MAGVQAAGVGRPVRPAFASRGLAAVGVGALGLARALAVLAAGGPALQGGGELLPGLGERLAASERRQAGLLGQLFLLVLHLLGELRHANHRLPSVHVPGGHPVRQSLHVLRGTLGGGQILRLGLFFDDAGCLFQPLPFFLDNAALHQKAGRDKNGEAGEYQGEDEQQQGRSKCLGLPGPSQGRGVGGLQADRVFLGISLLHLPEDRGFGDGGHRAGALKVQGGRQPLLQPQARLSKPGDVHRVQGLCECRDRTNGDAEGECGGDHTVQGQPIRQKVKVIADDGNEADSDGDQRAARDVAHPARQAQPPRDGGQGVFQRARIVFRLRRSFL